MPDKLKKYLGIDWGEKRIGLAVADNETKLAVPWGTVGNMDSLLDAIETEDADLLVVGLPVKMSGAQEELPAAMRDFLDKLKKRCDVPVEFLDERLTSKEADSRAAGSTIDRDAVAAMLILQMYIDRNF